MDIKFRNPERLKQVEEAIAKCGGRIAEYAAIGPVQKAEVQRVCLEFLAIVEQGKKALPKPETKPPFSAAKTCAILSKFSPEFRAQFYAQSEKSATKFVQNLVDALFQNKIPGIVGNEGQPWVYSTFESEDSLTLTHTIIYRVADLQSQPASKIQGMSFDDAGVTISASTLAGLQTIGRPLLSISSSELLQEIIMGWKQGGDDCLVETPHFVLRGPREAPVRCDSVSETFRALRGSLSIPPALLSVFVKDDVLRYPFPLFE